MNRVRSFLKSRPYLGAAVIALALAGTFAACTNGRGAEESSQDTLTNTNQHGIPYVTNNNLK